ncbi:hypothetical protein HC891_24650 [Candidatus Gracilibacteria bacterium]|nr:hypothetical protein [Candidatus Gracilibacteria bacterium]
MAPQQLRIAELDEARLARIRALEDRLGSIVVAYESRPTYAELLPDQLAALQDLERELGVVLVAYTPKATAVGV